MQPDTYATLPIRVELRQAIDRAWKRLANPGVWWSGAERLAMIDEIRSAPTCATCADIAEALSPASVQGHHTRTSNLPNAVIEVIHRVRNDSGRLSESWFDKTMGDGLNDAAYVEILGVLATTVALDTFALALGLPLESPPPPIAGAALTPAPKERETTDRLGAHDIAARSNRG